MTHKFHSGGLTPVGGRFKVDKKPQYGAVALSEGENAMTYGRIGVIGAMDSELAALVKKPDKTDQSDFRRF